LDAISPDGFKDCTTATCFRSILAICKNLALAAKTQHAALKEDRSAKFLRGTNAGAKFHSQQSHIIGNVGRVQRGGDRNRSSLSFLMYIEDPLSGNGGPLSVSGDRIAEGSKSCTRAHARTMTFWNRIPERKVPVIGNLSLPALPSLFSVRVIHSRCERLQDARQDR